MDGTNDERKQDESLWPWVIALAIFAGLTRLLPGMPFNFTAVGALGLFAGARLRSWLAFVVPMSVMVCSDFVLWGMYEFKYLPFDPFVYACFLLNVLVGRQLLRTGGPVRVAATSVMMSIVFFVVTNFGVWLTLSVDPASLPDGQAVTWASDPSAKFPFPDKYARNAAGLGACYAAAVPFYNTNATPFGFLGNQILGDLLFCSILFGAFALVKRGVAAPVFGKVMHEVRRDY